MKKIILTLLLLSEIGFSGVLEAMEDACESNVAEACYELGTIYKGNDGILIDLTKSKIYYAKACELGHDKSCSKLEKIKIENE